MPNDVLPILAAVACAGCNGTAAVLQKISADKERSVHSLDARLLGRLFQDKPYVIGVALDLLGWLFTLYAVQYLPLFLVEAVIAANIAVTALIERFWRHRPMQSKLYLALGLIIGGLVLLALAASPEKAKPISALLKWLILLTPLAIGLLGYGLARSKKYGATIGLAVLGGLAFGGTSVIGRIFQVSQPVWHTIYSPLVIALIVSGGLGILLFSIALQRAPATIVNATMTASQTIIPTIIGIVVLGDHARPGLGYVVVIGLVLALGGVSLLMGRQPAPLALAPDRV